MIQKTTGAEPVTVPVGSDTTGERPEPQRVKAGDLRRGMLVWTGDPDDPAREVRHVEPGAADSRMEDRVLVVYAGAEVDTYAAGALVDLVDQAVVDTAREQTARRARRTRMIEGLRLLAHILDKNPGLPTPRWSLDVTGVLKSPAEVRLLADELGVEVTERAGITSATWAYGDDGVSRCSPPFEFRFQASDGVR